MILKLIFVLLLIPPFIFCQFAPAAGQPGSTAIYKDSSLFIGWATQCTIERGYKNIAEPDSGLADFGEALNAIGMAGENGVVSLGDGGIATLSFDGIVFNGPGPDFAIFENSFMDEFLEFGFVEVSSDGINFQRFPNVSHIQDTLQTGPFGLSNPEQVNNLAGKYRALWGVPFDLDDIAISSIVNPNQITHIRVVDVVGSIDSMYGSRDWTGKLINDPWPTLFSSSGFDLDAIGVIHAVLSLNEIENKQLLVYPNPTKDWLYISNYLNDYKLIVTDVNGKIVLQKFNKEEKLEVSSLLPGIYFIKVISDSKHLCSRFVIKP